VNDDELKGLFEGLRQDLREEMQQGNASLRQEIAATRQEMRQENAAMRQENDAAHAETRRHIAVAQEANKHEIQLVAEIVVYTREELVRKVRELDEKIDSTAAETQAMIKFSHGELRARVERLESSTL